MDRLLILYPALFKCQTKFDRKVKSITCNMQELAICFLEDPNNFINEFIAKDNRQIGSEKIISIAGSGITHAIVFDDGHEFSQERSTLENQGTPTRWVKIAITRVINIKKETQYQNMRDSDVYEYIGRGSYWGNPHSMFEKGDSREEVIRKFQYDFEYDKFPNKSKPEVYKLAGKTLGCFCKPAACHGDILADFLNTWDDGN